jgi:iron complex outermembrane receptor protein
MKKRPLSSTFGVLAGLACGAVSAQVVAVNSLADLSLEQLSNIEVTSVSGRAESLQDAPGSIYVITSDDIRRSAALTLPQALRLAPNLQVASLNAGQYAISARGFNNAIGNKLLVLIDGRTIYSSLFSGVFWDANDLMLEDVDRIEVISGPGGTLWGANAVNGVINVITRSASATPGVLASVTAGDGGGQAVARYGASLANGGNYRVYALTQERVNTYRADHVQRPDSASKDQVGFRADWGSAADGVTVQGDAYRGGKDPSFNLAPKLEGANLLARWNGQFANGSGYRLQAYVDHAKRDETATFRNTADSVDLQFSHEPTMAAGQHLLWGGGYRRTRDANDPSAGGVLAFVPAVRNLTWTNLFAQHESELTPKLHLTLGAKVERNVYSGTEFLPSARISYKSDRAGLSWAALSRAVRAPARLDRDLFIPAKGPFAVGGGPNFDSEVANVLEVGQRGFIGNDLSYSVTLFRQDYDRLRSGAAGQLVNQIAGHSTGLEAWASWQARPNWRLAAGLLELRKSLHLVAPSTDNAGIANLGNDPRHQWSLRSSWDFSARHQLDVMVRHVGALPAPAVEAYTAVDANWSWKLTPAFTASLLAQNLFDRRHVEFNAVGVASQIERRVFVRLAWQL